MESNTVIIHKHLINSKAPAEVCNAFRDMSERLQALRTEGRDFAAFINWIVQEIDDEDQLVRIIKRARENPQGMNDDCKLSIDTFLSLIAEDLDCDHDVGVCACRVRVALGLDGGGLWEVFGA